MTEQCIRILEATNAGHYFADCGCGWSGGVHDRRAKAAAAWAAHRDGLPRVEPVKPIVQFGPRACGQETI